jgi:hypothetical protein
MRRCKWLIGDYPCERSKKYSDSSGNTVAPINKSQRVAISPEARSGVI